MNHFDYLPSLLSCMPRKTLLPLTSSGWQHLTLFIADLNSARPYRCQFKHLADPLYDVEAIQAGCTSRMYLVFFCHISLADPATIVSRPSFVPRLSFVFLSRGFLYHEIRKSRDRRSGDWCTMQWKLPIIRVKKNIPVGSALFVPVFQDCRVYKSPSLTGLGSLGYRVLQESFQETVYPPPAGFRVATIDVPASPIQDLGVAYNIDFRTRHSFG